MILNITIIFTLSFLLQLVLPWWIVIFPSFIVAVWRLNSGRLAFISGFAGVGSLWFICAVFIHIKNSSILAERLSQMLNLPGSIFVIVITVLIGGVVAGLAAVSGFYFGQAFSK